jgi:hypothetical protein
MLQARFAAARSSRGGVSGEALSVRVTKRFGDVRDKRPLKRRAFLGPQSGQSHLLQRAGNSFTAVPDVNDMVPLGQVVVE